MSEETVRRLGLRASVSNPRLMHFVLGVHLAVSAYVFADLSIPNVGGILGLVYFVLVPGALVLRLSGIRDLAIADRLVLSTGLSLAVTSLIVLFEMQLPDVQSLDPSTMKISIILVTTGLLGLTWQLQGAGGHLWPVLRRYADDLYPLRTAEKGALFLSSSAFSAVVVATQIAPDHQVGGFTVAYLLVAGAFVAISRRRVRRSFLLSCLVILATTLIYSKSLLSPYLVGYDLLHNFYHVKYAMGLGDPQLSSSSWEKANYATMLTYQAITPGLSYFSGLSLVQIYKWVYPALIAVITTISLFTFYERSLNHRNHATLATILFISSLSFFAKTPAVIKAVTAELFFFPLLIASYHAYNARSKRYRGLVFIFGFGLILSHYSTTFLLFLLLALGSIAAIVLNEIFDLHIRELLPLNVTLILGVGFFAWYANVTGSLMFDKIITTVVSYLRVPGGAQVSQVSAQGSGIAATLLVVITVVVIFTSAVGVATKTYSLLVSLRRSEPVESDGVMQLLPYAAVALSGFAIFVAGDTIFGVQRYLHFALIFTGPFVIVVFSDYFPALGLNQGQASAICVTFLIAFLLLNTGVLSAYTDETPIQTFGTEDIETTEQDVHSSAFLLSYTSPSTIRSGDTVFPKIASAYYEISPLDAQLYKYDTPMIEYSSLQHQEIDGYVISFAYETEENHMLVEHRLESGVLIEEVETDEVMREIDHHLSNGKIYSNGDSYVYEGEADSENELRQN